MNSKNPTVSLVLGSGGARGLAHIGIIECLVASGFVIRSIAGTSMGALVGGIFATGKLDRYRDWVTTLQRSDVIRLLDLSFGNNGLIKGERVINTLLNMIGNTNIEDLDIRFTAIATDIDAGNEVRITDGPLFNAIRASIGIPSVFTPYHYRDRMLVDGSLVNPIPVSATLNDDTDLTIAVNLNGTRHHRSRPEVERKAETAGPHQGLAGFIGDIRDHFNSHQQNTLGLFDVIARSMNIMEDTIARSQLSAHTPDLVIEIPRDACSFYEFYRARELIEMGRNSAHQVLSNAGIPDQH